MKEKINNHYKNCTITMYKGILIAIIIYFLAILIISCFLGSLFSNQEIIAGKMVTNPGWMKTHFYLLILCALFALAGFFIYCKKTIDTRMKELDSLILLKEDNKSYLELLDYALELGKSRKITGLAKYYYVLLEHRYVYALVFNKKIDLACYYLDHMWKGSRKGALYQKPYAFVQLALAYLHQDLKSYDSVYEKYKSYMHDYQYVKYYHLLLRDSKEELLELLKKQKDRDAFQNIYIKS